MKGGIFYDEKDLDDKPTDEQFLSKYELYSAGQQPDAVAKLSRSMIVIPDYITKQGDEEI